MQHQGLKIYMLSTLDLTGNFASVQQQLPCPTNTDGKQIMARPGFAAPRTYQELPTAPQNCVRNVD